MGRTKTAFRNRYGDPEPCPICGTMSGKVENCIAYCFECNVEFNTKTGAIFAIKENGKRLRLEEKQINLRIEILKKRGK